MLMPSILSNIPSPVFHNISLFYSSQYYIYFNRLYFVFLRIFHFVLSCCGLNHFKYARKKCFYMTYQILFEHYPVHQGSSYALQKHDLIHTFIIFLMKMVIAISSFYNGVSSPSLEWFCTFLCTCEKIYSLSTKMLKNLRFCKIQILGW